MESLLCDQEVFSLLKDHEEQRKKGLITPAPGQQPQNLLTIEFEVKKYLSESPGGFQAASEVTAVLQALKGFKLTKAEKLQIVNLRPATLVELHLIIEECDERFTDKDIAKIRNIIDTHLTSPDTHETATPPASSSSSFAHPEQSR